MPQVYSTHRIQMFMLLFLACMSSSTVMLLCQHLYIPCSWANLHKYLPPGVCKWWTVGAPIKRHYFPISSFVFDGTLSSSQCSNSLYSIQIVKFFFWLVAIILDSNTFSLIISMSTVNNFTVAWTANANIPIFGIYALLLFTWNVCRTKVLVDNTEHLYMCFKSVLNKPN